MIRDWRKTAVSHVNTIRFSMTRMDEAGVPICLVCDSTGRKDKSRLVGTLTDGDIRRWILSGGDIDSPVAHAMNVKPIVEWVEQPYRPVPSWCNFVPVIDPDGHIIGLRDLRSPAQPATVVIMAGGLGTRLRPLTNDTPKPMLEVGGKPIIVRLVEQLVAQGLNDIYISVGYKADVIKDHFGTSRYDATIHYLEEDSARGTAGALALLPKTTAPVLVVNGDVMTDVDFRKMIAFHTEHGADATMAVREFKMKCEYGVVQTDGVKVAEIVEKPEIGVKANAGIYVLAPQALKKVPHATSYKNQLDQAWQQQIAQDYPVKFDMPDLIRTVPNTIAFPLVERWVDVGSPQTFAEAQKEYGE